MIRDLFKQRDVLFHTVKIVWYVESCCLSIVQFTEVTQVKSSQYKRYKLMKLLKLVSLFVNLRKQPLLNWIATRQRLASVRGCIHKKVVLLTRYKTFCTILENKFD